MHDEKPLEENINRLEVDGDIARSVDDAIAILSVSGEKVDLHPEKRVKAAYQAFEEKNLPLLKAENPNLRLSQLKQMLKKDWMKSPENPLNQR
nr:coiled-coil domain-containing protein 124 [Parasteatoda tepidariorum]